MIELSLAKFTQRRRLEAARLPLTAFLALAVGSISLFITLAAVFVFSEPVALKSVSFEIVATMLGFCFVVGTMFTLVGMIVAGPFVVLLQVAEQLSLLTLMLVAILLSGLGLLAFRSFVAAEELKLGATVALGLMWSIPGVAIALVVWRFASESLYSWDDQ